MASILTHMAIPLAASALAGKANISGKLFFYALVASMLPDIDVIAFMVGIPYESILGHRGFTHSVVFAILTGLFASCCYRYLQAKPVVVFILIFISTLSHPLLDALTNGGHGVALLWPLSNERLFLPWPIIEVSPIGLRNFLSDTGLAVLWSEFKVVWLPCSLLVTLGLFAKSVLRRRK